MIQYVEGKPIVYVHPPIYATVEMPVTGVETTIFETTVENNGRQAWLIFLANATAPGGEDFVTYNLYIRDMKKDGYIGFADQLADPADLNQTLPRFIPLEGGDKVRLTGANSDAANAYNATGRAVIVYTPL